jgi:hypothetical protein
MGSLVQEKFDDYSLIIFHPKRTLNGFEETKRENNYGVNHVFETDLIYLTFRKVYILEISSREMQTPELSA